MAEVMTPLCTVLLAAALASTPAFAQQGALPDPTRPPSSVLSPVSPAGQLAAPGVPQVQSILVSTRPGGRRIAVINGKTLRRGDRVGGAVLETIEPTYVVLRRGSQKQILKLFRSAPRADAA